ncbi:MAG: hypothetical protein V7603_4686 [Micromonosporaceae bacterium]
MRLANVGGRAHLVSGDRIVDIERVSGGRFPADPMAVFPCWAELSTWAAHVDVDGAEVLDPTGLAAPVPHPRQVFAVASNYRDRPVVVEGSGPLPVTFTKFPSSLAGPYAKLPLPTATVDWEVELVVVIGRPTHAVPEDLAWDFVAGVTIGQDYSERTLQLGGPTPQFSLAKSFANFGPTGPVLVTTDELADRDGLDLRCTVNGATVQEANTRQMILPVPALVSRLSAVCTLLPGDLVFTGTPGGLGMSMRPPRYLRVGDEVRSHITGIGELCNVCVPAGPPEP